MELQSYSSIQSKRISYLFFVPKHTSQRCSRCGHTEKENRETQASFKCLSCGLSINADLNAAINMEMEAFGHLDRKDE